VKADVWQQHSLLELAGVDAEVGRITHRAKNLPEQQHVDAVRAEQRAAEDRAAALGLAIEDLDVQITKFESEIDSVRQREDRDRALIGGGAVNAKQVGDLQHELETLQRRQASLEDSLLEVMERREQLQAQRAVELARVEELGDAVASGNQALADALAGLESARTQSAARRAELVASLNEDLLSAYERQRAHGGPGAGQLQGHRCGACRIEIDRGELARISAAADDEVLRCPECGAILIRVAGFTK